MQGHGYDLSGLRILIVEQHLVMRLLYRSLLRTFNILHVADTGDVAEALQRFQHSNPDIILLDWSPSFPGLGFLKMVRGPRSPNRFVPVIMVSSYSEPESVIEARDAGVTGFLAKPITARLIYQRICTAIENHRSFVKTSHFFGPDRRHHQVAFKGKDRRKADAAKPTDTRPPAAAEPAADDVAVAAAANASAADKPEAR